MLNNPYIAKLLVEARTDDLRRDAAGASRAEAAHDDAGRRSKRGGVPRESPRIWHPWRPWRPLSRACDPCP